MLNKNICSKCRNKQVKNKLIHRRWKWKDMDDFRWEGGMVWCKLKIERLKIERMRLIKIKYNPPNHCKYYLEQVISDVK